MNPLCGAPRIPGELLKLGPAHPLSLCGRPLGQAWRTCLRSRTTEIAAMRLFVVPTDSTSMPLITVDAWPETYNYE